MSKLSFLLDPLYVLRIGVIWYPVAVPCDVLLAGDAVAGSITFPSWLWNYGAASPATFQGELGDAHGPLRNFQFAQDYDYGTYSEVGSPASVSPALLGQLLLLEPGPHLGARPTLSASPPHTLGTAQGRFWQSPMCYNRW